MPFNADSYRRNQYRRDAVKRLAIARQLKADGESGWRIESAVSLARSSWRLYLIGRRICELSPRAAPYRPAPWTSRKGVEQ